MNYVWTASSPLLSPFIKGSQHCAYTDKSFSSSVVSSHTFSYISHITVYSHLCRLFCFQWAKCLIGDFSATMTNIAPSVVNPFQEASLIYYKCKPSLRFISFFFFFLSVYITTRETLSHFSLTDPVRAHGYCWSVLIATENSKSASSKQARRAPFIIMSTAVTFYHRNPEHDEAGVFCDFRVRNHFWWAAFTKQFKAFSLQQ